MVPLGICNKHLCSKTTTTDPNASNAKIATDVAAAVVVAASAAATTALSGAVAAVATPATTGAVAAVQGTVTGRRKVHGMTGGPQQFLIRASVGPHFLRSSAISAVYLA